MRRISYHCVKLNNHALTKLGTQSFLLFSSEYLCVIEDNFDANNELGNMLRTKSKDAQADKMRNIIPECVECILVR